MMDIKEYQRQYRLNNRVRLAVYGKKWREENREKKRALDRKYAAEHRGAANLRAKVWYASNKSRPTENYFKRVYGITIEDYANLLKAQNGECKICGGAPKKKRLHVDHCHKTGKVRGLLCHNCNLMLGRRGIMRRYLGQQRST